MFEDHNGIKLFERKLDFWNSFENLESRRLFKENWDFRVYLKIGLSGIKCENENFYKLNLNKVGNLKMIWEFEILNEGISGWVNK